MELVKESMAVEETVHSGRSQILVDGDIIVPDVKPDILKILQVDAVAVVSNKEVCDGKVIIKGCVQLKILYIPDVEDECIKSILTSFDYSHKIDKDCILEGMMPNVAVDVDKVEFRLINSRKLSVKAIVGVDINVCGVKNIDMVTNINDNNAQVMRIPVKINTLAANCEREMVVKECVEVPSGKASINEILKVDARISDKDIKALTCKSVVKGVVNASILYVGDNSSVEFMEVDLPMTEVFDVPDMAEGLDCDIDFNICELFYEVEEDNDGDRRIVNIEFVICASIKATANVDINVIDDCFMPKCNTDLMRQEFTLDEVVSQPRVQNTIREIVGIDASSPEISQVYHVVTKPNVTGTNIENGKVCIDGNIDCYILYLCENNETPVYSYKKVIPFSYSLDGADCKNGMECDVKADVEHSSYSLNAASEVELRIILSVSAKVIRKRKLNLISEANTSEMSTQSKNGIIVYFIQNNDSMWDIAKRYKVSIDDVMQYNNIAEGDKLKSGSRLIIPTGR